MKRITLAILCISLLTLTGLALTGCGMNRAEDALPPAAAAEAPAVPSQPDAANENEPRGLELAAREEAVAQLEDDLDQRMRELERRLADAERLDERPRSDENAAADTPVSPFPRRLPPEPEPQPAFRTVNVTVPASTRLEIELRETLSSETSAPGDRVEALVVSDVLQDEQIAVPAGSRVFGTVEEAVGEKKIGGQSFLGVSFDRLLLPSGEEVDVAAYFAAEGKKQKKKDAATIGGAAAGGAVLGRVLSKNDRTKGTLIGAVLGGAIGTAIATQNNGDPVVLEAGTVVDLFLEAPVRIAVTAPAAQPTVVATYR